MSSSEGGRKTSHFPGFIPELWGGNVVEVYEGGEEWEPSSPKPLAGGSRAGSSSTCQGYASAMCLDICCIKGVEVHVCAKIDSYSLTVDGLKHTCTEWLETGPTSISFFIPLVITHGAYVCVGHLSLKPSKDIVHHCMLSGFIWVQCFSSSLISSWLTTNA